MNLPVMLQNDIIDFLTSLPSLVSNGGKRALIVEAGLDQKLQSQINTDQPTREFVISLLPILSNYGKLSDGRFALEALLKASQKQIGVDRQEYCELLIRNVQIHRELYEENERLKRVNQELQKRIEEQPGHLLISETTKEEPPSSKRKRLIVVTIMICAIIGIAIIVWSLFLSSELRAFPQDGLILFSSLNGNADDKSGHQHHGTISPRTGYINSGVMGKAAKLDGVEDYITFPKELDFSRDQDFSVLMVLFVYDTQVDQGTGQNEIIGKWTGNEQEGYPYVIRYLNQTHQEYGKIVAGRYDGNEAPSVISSVKVNDNKFHLVSFIKRDQSLYLYIDAAEVGMSMDTTTGDTVNNSKVYIGKRGEHDSKYDSYFRGIIDSVIMYNRALSPSEIYELYKKLNL